VREIWGPIAKMGDEHLQKKDEIAKSLITNVEHFMPVCRREKSSGFDVTDRR